MTLKIKVAIATLQIQVTIRPTDLAHCAESVSHLSFLVVVVKAGVLEVGQMSEEHRIRAETQQAAIHDGNLTKRSAFKDEI